MNVATRIPSPPAAAGALLSNGTLRLPFVVAAVVALLLLLSVLAVRNNDVADGFDELAHVSYVAEMQSRDASPRLEQLRMLDPANFKFTSQSNYINHAAPYYHAMASIGPRLEGNPAALVWHRLINVAIMLCGFGLLLATGLALARSLDEAMILLIGLFCVPALAPLAGSVSNDNLAFLAGALLIFGSQRFLANGRGIDLGIAGAGVALAGAAKLTALLLCGGYFIVFVAIAARHAMIALRHWAIIGAALLLAVAAPVDLWLAYGSPAPNTPAQYQGLVDGAVKAGWAQQDRLGPLAYAAAFLGMFLESWKPLLVDRSAFQTALLALPAMIALLAIGGAALAACSILLRQARLDATATLAVSGALASAATLIIHMAFSYERHLETGWMMDAYSRYYLPLYATVPLAALLVLRHVRGDRTKRALAAFLMGAPIVFAIAG